MEPRITPEELLERSLPVGDHAALLRVGMLATDVDADLRAVAREAAGDGAFAALVLRLANSAALGGRFRVGDLPTAIARLGLRLVGTLAVAAPALRLLEASPRDDLVRERRALHEHAVQTGITARLLALPAVEPEAALAAGLLHNVGLALVSVHAPGAFRDLVELARLGERLALHEPELLGVTHAELGARLAERWSYPPLLVRAIREHDRVEPESPLARTVRVADLLARRAGRGVEPPEPLETGLVPAPEGTVAAGVERLVAGSAVSSRDLAAALLHAA